MFDRAVCLLLDQRSSERERLRADFAKNGINLEFFVAGDGQTLPAREYNHVDVAPPPRTGYPAWAKRPNSYNAFLCYQKILGAAMRDGLENILLVEDDTVLMDNFSEVLQKAFFQLVKMKSPWDMLYLGANHAFSRTEQVSENLLRLNGSGCFHCVALQHSVFLDVLQLPMNNPIDGVVAKHIHPKRNCYAVWPNIALTKPGFSHCEGRDVDYGDMFKQKGC